MAKKQAEASKRPRTHTEINEFRRASFINGAIRSLAEHGVSGTTVSTICSAAGSSRGLLGHYFANKDDVMVAALQHLFSQISQQVHSGVQKRANTPVARLNALPVELFSDGVFTDVNRTAFLSLWHETKFNKAVRKANRRLYDDYISRMERMFDDAATELAITIDARRAALGLIGLTDGLWLGMSIHDEVITKQQAIKICQGHIAQELRVQ